MAAVKPSIKDILSLEKIPIVLEKSFEGEVFVMDHHVYKETSTPFLRKRRRLLLGKNWTQRCNRIMLRTNMLLLFYSIKVPKESRCQIIVHGKAVNPNDWLKMKVPSRLSFTADEKFIDILKERRP